MKTKSKKKKITKTKSSGNRASLKDTRFEKLGYRKEANQQWSIYDKETGGSIGAKYKTQKELLGDLERFAKERGYDE